jgi:hypothetical protein
VGWFGRGVGIGGGGVVRGVVMGTLGGRRRVGWFGRGVGIGGGGVVRGVVMGTFWGV